ncbi:MAG: GNAT family N-acetyltransferase [Rhodobacter sp.]|nr:GNAT family N-acetyltransferase [Rhodobacter sp.]
MTFRNASQAELAEVLDWAAREGWNPGLDDAAAFYAADPQGFFVATKDDVPVASISVVNHSDSFAFLGLYIVRPEFRGQGIGHALWQHALRHAGARTVGLDGVPEQQANYRASGFLRAGETTRFAGPVEPLAGNDIRLADGSDVGRLIDAEAAASGHRKDAYLSAWTKNTDLRKTLVHSRNGRPVGFATVRKCRQDAKIGPLVAEDLEAARRLLHHAATFFDGGIVIDVPAGSEDLAALCVDLGLSPGFRTARMYRGDVPKGQGACFAVSSLELG